MPEPDRVPKSVWQQLAQGLQHYGQEFVALYKAERDTIVELMGPWRKDKTWYWNAGHRLHLLTNVLTEAIRALPYTLSHALILWAAWHYLVAPLLGLGQPPPCSPSSLAIQP